MDQQVYWTNLFHNPAEPENLVDYLLSTSDTNMANATGASQENASLSIFGQENASSSIFGQENASSSIFGDHSLNQGSQDESQENAGLSIFGSSDHSLNQGSQDERQLQVTGTPALGNININLNSNQMDNDQPLSQDFSSAVSVQNDRNQLDNDQLFPQNSSSTVFVPNADHYAGIVDTRSQVTESGICTHPFSAGMLGSEHASSSGGSSNARGNSFLGAGFSEDNEGRPSGSFDGRRLSHKRKNIEGISEQPSASGTSTTCHQRENSPLVNNLNICRPSDSLSGASSGQVDSRTGSTIGVVVSDSLPSGNLTGNAENSQRNSRMRVSPAQQQDTTPHNLWEPGNAPDLSSLWSANQQSSLTIPFSQQTNQQPSLSIQLRRHSLEPRTVVAGASSQSRSRVPVLLPRNLPPWYGASNSRLGSSPSSPIILDERRPTSRDETNTRRASRTMVQIDAIMPPRQAAPHLVRANGSPTLPGNVAPVSQPSTSSVAHQLLGSPWASHQRTTHYESVFPSPFSTSGSGSLGHRANALRNQQAAASQDSGHQSGAFVSGPGSLAHRANALRNQLAAASQDAGHQSGAFLSGPGSLAYRANALRNQLAASSQDTGHQSGAFVSGPGSLAHRANALRNQLAAASQDTGHQSGPFDTGNQSGVSGNPSSYTRSVFIDRQRDGPPGVPGLARVPTAPRDGRNRMLSEIRNMLDSMRRGENLRIEDILMFDQFFADGDVLDRHRDMRLDVDNMSYEELLALEEQIGDVNTGLNEETILKSLKRLKYSSAAVEASDGVEPCCICQEEYVDAEELGALDCGHDFHYDCIKQWLMQKNVCPICKTTGLSKT